MKKRYLIIVLIISILFTTFFLFNNLKTIERNVKIMDKEESKNYKDNEKKENRIDKEVGIVKLLQTENENITKEEKLDNKSIQKCIVSFDYGVEYNDIKNKEVTYLEEYGNLPIPKRKGYTFIGWYDSYGEKVNDKTKVKFNIDHTLHARYIINNYKVTYDYNYLKDNLFKKLLSEDSWSKNKFEVLTNDDVFFNQNVYKFKFSNKESILEYKEKIELEENKTYTFSLYIKSNEEKNLLLGYEDDLISVKVNSSWQRVTKTFNTSSNKYNNFIFKLDNDSKFNENDTLYIYDLSLGEGNLNTKEEVKEYNKTLELLNDNTREGYIFDGWYTDLAFSEKLENVRSADSIYYAKWIPKLYTLKVNTNNSVNTYIQGFQTSKKIDIPKAYYKVSYDLNDMAIVNSKKEDIIGRNFKGFRDDNNELITSDMYIFNKDLNLTPIYEEKVNIKLDSISKEGYVCSWNTNKDGNGTNYNSTDNINIDSDITLYAVCKYDSKFERPLNSGYVTSEYGYRIHPIYKSSKLHTGIDISGLDKNIYPIKEGEVKKVGYNSSMGNYIVIHHKFNGENYTSAYYHLESKYVKKGDNVNKDTIIGKMGQTGLATGVHLHLTMYKGHLYDEPSNIVNPRDYINFPSKLYVNWQDKFTSY